MVEAAVQAAAAAIAPELLTGDHPGAARGLRAALGLSRPPRPCPAGTRMVAVGGPRPEARHSFGPSGMSQVTSPIALPTQRSSGLQQICEAAPPPTGHVCP